MARFTIEVNGKRVETESPNDRSLLEVLREDFDLTGTKYGCGEGQCRACTVLIDGDPRPSCLTPIATVAGKYVTTIEGLALSENLTAIQQAFVDTDAAQCGYCTPGMIMNATALLARNPSPDRKQILEVMNPHLCRCCGYLNIVEAIEVAARAKEARRG
jgi:aerobic-type carbon monoxide dehydrogenase small subunit (CoxS/CutS family)